VSGLLKGIKNVYRFLLDHLPRLILVKDADPPNKSKIRWGQIGRGILIDLVLRILARERFVSDVKGFPILHRFIVNSF